jgi:hypothetical protein
VSLDGSLEDFDLADVLQLIHIGARTGVLTLTHDKITAHIFFQSGEPIHAEMGNLNGENVIYNVFNWKKGHFRFDTSATTNQSTISNGCQNIIMEATRRLDEWTKLRAVIPSQLSVIGFEAEPGERSSNITLKSNEWRILSLVNGQRTVEEIINESGFSEFETTRILFGLVNSGLLKVLGEKSAADLAKETKKGTTSTSGIRDILTRISGSGVQGGMPIAEELEVGTTMASQDRAQIMQIFINNMLEEWAKPDGLYNEVELTRSLEALVRDRQSRFPGLMHLKVIDNVIHMPHSSLSEREKEDIALGLADLSEDLFLMSVKQSNLSAASRRFNRVLARIFGSTSNLEHSPVADILQVKGKK